MLAAETRIGTMLRIARNVIGMVAATALLILLMVVAFVMARATPQINFAWYLGGASIVYSFLILLWLNR